MPLRCSNSDIRCIEENSVVVPVKELTILVLQAIGDSSFITARVINKRSFDKIDEVSRVPKVEFDKCLSPLSWLQLDIATLVLDFDIKCDRI